MSNFLDKAQTLGNEARAEANHGNGTGDEANAKDWIEFFGEHLEGLNEAYQNKKGRLEKQFPNLAPNAPCPRCKGEMRIDDYEHGNTYSEDGKMPCPTCEGNG